MTDLTAPADPGAILGAAPALAALLPLATIACDARGMLCWANAKAVALWGRALPAGYPSRRLWAVQDGDDQGAERLLSGAASELEMVIPHADGQRVVMAKAEQVRGYGDTLLGTIICCEDVTLRRREAQRQHADARHFRALVEALPAAIYTTDATGRITYYNHAAVALSGRRPALGSDEWCVTWQLFTPDGTPLPHADCPMAVALREDREVRGVEAVLERPDGTRVPFLPFPTPLHDEAGRLTGAVNMLVDVSERKQAETQQLALQAELNHRVKNNMQMLHGLLQAARRDMQNPEARQAIDDAIQRVGAVAAAQKALYLAGNAARYDAQSFLDAVCESAAHSFASTVRIDATAGPEMLGNDTAVPLALILNELLANAARHGTDAAGVATIRVAITRIGEDLVLSIEDDGPGFAFEQGRRRSSGLGLVTGLARQIGGSLTVERGRGARCSVRFRDSPGH